MGIVFFNLLGVLLKEINKVYNEDCLEGMRKIDTGIVDMILTDLPYGVTALNGIM